MSKHTIPFLLAAAVAFAQTAEITGRVSDPGGGVVPNCSVKLTNVETGIARETNTNETGYYVIPSVQPGRYEIALQAQGFKPVRQTGIVLAVQQAARLDFTLQIGSLQETVEVSAAAPLLESSNAALGHVIENKRIVDLPLNGRQFLEYALLGSGVVRGRPGDVRAAQQGISIHANGLYAKNNNFLLDGADNNESFQNQFVTEPSVDAIEEFKVQTTLYSAEFGRGGGAVVNVVTKSGTNQYRGTLFWFLRNDKFDAKNFFVPANEKNPPLRRNQFGGSLGGPIVRDRTHFFLNYDGIRRVTTSTNTALTPTLVSRTGDLRGLRAANDPSTGAPFPNNIVPASRVSPVSAKLIAFWPEPNQPDPVRNFLNSARSTDDRHSGIARVDHRFSNADSVYGRFGMNKNDYLNAGASPRVGGILNNDGTRSAVLNWMRTMSPSRLNTLSLGFNRFVQDSRGQTVGNPVARDAGITGISLEPRDLGFPEGINFSAGTGFLSLGERAVRIRHVNTYQILDTLNWVQGAHNVRIGGEVRWAQANILQTAATQGSFTFNGQYSGNSFAEFLLGIPSSTGVSVGINLVYPRRKTYAAFIQDDWKVTPDLTLNLGLRYQLDMPVTDARGQLSGFDHDTGEIVFPANANLGDFYTAVRPDIKVRKYSGNTLYDTDKNNFAPRAGLAWRPFGNKKTSLRSGFGIFHMAPELNSEMNTGNTPPFQLRIDEVGNARVPNLSWALKGDPALLRSAQFGIFTFNANRDFTTGYVMQWTGEIQRELPGAMVFRAGYVANRGVKIDSHVVRNQRPPGPGAATARRYFPAFARIRSYESTGWTSYHSLQTSIERRFSRGLHFLGAYTWGKAMDFGWTQDSCCQQDIDNLAAEKGLAAHDIRHRFTSNVLYETPWKTGSRAANYVVAGWRLGAIATLHTGFPGNPAVSGNSDNVPDNTDRPDRIGRGDLPNPGLDGWWDPRAFRVQAPFTFGNSGRNVLTRPGQVNFDFIAGKMFPLRERKTIEFRAEFFNVTNTPAWGGPVENISNVTFGKIFSALTPRQVQFGLKYYF